MNKNIPEIYIPFLPDTQITVNSHDDAINEVESKYSFNEATANTNDIKLGKGIISINGKDYRATRWALESLFKLFGLSKSTAVRLELNDLIKFIDILKNGQRKEVSIFLDKTDNRIINIVKLPYHRVSNRDAIKMIQGLDASFSWTTKRINISGRGVHFSLVSDVFGKLEPVVGDITKIGFSIINSDTGGFRLKAAFLLYRLKCQNGAILEDRWGEARWTPDRNMNSSLKAFRNQIENMMLSSKLIELKYAGLLSNQITDLDFRKLFRNLSRIVGSEDADSILEIEEKKRKKILRELKEREKKQKKINPEEKPEPVLLDKYFYEILQMITDKAKKYPFHINQSLEKLGGKIIG
jgi:hypothetical protein